MKRSIAGRLILAALWIPAADRAFTNLDFESGVVQLNDPVFG
jgi:hypothetical protein